MGKVAVANTRERRRVRRRFLWSSPSQSAEKFQWWTGWRTKEENDQPVWVWSPTCDVQWNVVHDPRGQSVSRFIDCQDVQPLVREYRFCAGSSSRYVYRSWLWPQYLAVSPARSYDGKPAQDPAVLYSNRQQLSPISYHSRHPFTNPPWRELHANNPDFAYNPFYITSHIPSICRRPQDRL